MPYAFFLAFVSYSFLLFFEKVAFNMRAVSSGHTHSHHNEELQNDNLEKVKAEKPDNEPEQEDEEEESLKDAVSSRGRLASFMHLGQSNYLFILVRRKSSLGLMDPGRPISRSLYRTSKILQGHLLTEDFEKGIESDEQAINSVNSDIGTQINVYYKLI
jgi:hypothetical protein